MKNIAIQITNIPKLTNKLELKYFFFFEKKKQMVKHMHTLNYTLLPSSNTILVKIVFFFDTLVKIVKKTKILVLYN